MNKDSLATIVNAGVNTMLNELGKILADRIQAGQDEGEELHTIVRRVVKEVQSDFKPTPSQPSNTKSTSVGTGTAKPKSTPKDVLKDANNNVIICEGIKKTDQSRCTFGAKYVYGGKHLCGTHYKTASGTKPDPKKKPTVSGTKTGSSQSTSSLNDALNDLDAEDVDIEL